MVYAEAAFRDDIRGMNTDVHAPGITQSSFQKTRSLLSPNLRLPMTEGQPVNLPHEIRIADREIHALHIFFSVPMTHDGVGYKRMQVACHPIDRLFPSERTCRLWTLGLRNRTFAG